MSISISVEAVLGTHIRDVLESAFRVAVTLGLAYVSVHFNGSDIAIYPDGRAVGMGEDKRTWRRVGTQGWMAQ